jgi:hypothetical membrane protein
MKIMKTTIKKTGKESQVPKTMLRVMFICGILSSLLYVFIDIIAGMMWEGYSFAYQAISELSAIGAPSRPLVAPLLIVYGVLLIPFGLGVWKSAGQNRALRITGGLWIGIGLVGLAWTPFPMHLGEPVSSFANTMHSIFAGVQVVLVLLAIGFGAVAYRNWFRFYSIGTILTLLAAGIVAFWQAASGQEAWFGAIERINVYGYLLWVAVLAILLIRSGENINKIRHKIRISEI